MYSTRCVCTVLTTVQHCQSPLTNLAIPQFTPKGTAVLFVGVIRTVILLCMVQNHRHCKFVWFVGPNQTQREKLEDMAKCNEELQVILLRVGCETETLLFVDICISVGKTMTNRERFGQSDHREGSFAQYNSNLLQNVFSLLSFRMFRKAITKIH